MVVLVLCYTCGMNKISWLGTVASIMGAFTVAMKVFLLGYCFFIVGSVSWLLVGLSRRDSSLITLNGTFFLANLVGFYNALA